jgi:hypothetical protein
VQEGISDIDGGGKRAEGGKGYRLASPSTHYFIAPASIIHAKGVKKSLLSRKGFYGLIRSYRVPMLSPREPLIIASGRRAVK